ncbi:hypothetical protein M5K25_006950 [Dendrobium thyrsiflorum]|uniref:Uncharacterized protein n=1 Tax=Dendrobium thyrsiflorum TaxID=117978 RepID=A0ABD0VCZ4_DENTH
MPLRGKSRGRGLICNLRVVVKVSVQWKRLSTNNEPPPPRAYHSMTCIGARYILFGGFDGKTTFGDIWWLVPEDDPIARRPLPNPPDISNQSAQDQSAAQSAPQENLQVQSAVLELQKKLGISISSSDAQVNVIAEVNDKELLELSTKLVGEVLPTSDQAVSIQALREHWKTCDPNSVQLRELGALLRDYQRLIINQHSDVSYVQATDVDCSTSLHSLHVVSCHLYLVYCVHDGPAALACKDLWDLAEKARARKKDSYLRNEQALVVVASDPTENIEEECEVDEAHEEEPKETRGINKVLHSNVDCFNAHLHTERGFRLAAENFTVDRLMANLHSFETNRRHSQEDTGLGFVWELRAVTDWLVRRTGEGVWAGCVRRTSGGAGRDERVQDGPRLHRTRPD